MDKLQIANELLKNTASPIKELLAEYIAMFEDVQNKNRCIVIDELINLDLCISYIQVENFDMTNWKLNEIPVGYVYCFYNPKKNQAFDLGIGIWNYEEVTPLYTDLDWNNQRAKSIQEAIEKYNAFLRYCEVKKL